MIRFADEFETAVGSNVTNVSSSAAQLEAAAGTLTRTVTSKPSTPQARSDPALARARRSAAAHASAASMAAPPMSVTPEP